MLQTFPGLNLGYKKRARKIIMGWASKTNEVEPVMSPQRVAWLLHSSAGTHERDWPAGCGVQRINVGEYPNRKARSGLVKVRSTVWAESAIDSPQKHRQRMTFIIGLTS